mgnify:CR=1 FL=1
MDNIDNNKSGIKEYLVHDNGGRPFRVVINFDEKNIKVYNALGEEISFEMNAGLSQIRIDTKGLFMLQIQSKDSVYRQNILVY